MNHESWMLQDTSFMIHETSSASLSAFRRTELLYYFKKFYHLRQGFRCG